EDLNRIATLLGIETISEIVDLYETCDLTYGCVDRASPARRIDSADAIDFEGIDQWLKEFDECWWQRWGGVIYGVKQSGDGFNVKVLGSRHGQYQPLPRWITR